MKNEIPPNVANAFNNTEDLLRNISDEGLRELNFSAKDRDKTHITVFGIEMKMRNRDSEIFKVIVCPVSFSDSDVFRRVILDSGESIKKNFPNISVYH